MYQIRSSVVMCCQCNSSKYSYRCRHGQIKTYLLFLDLVLTMIEDNTESASYINCMCIRKEYMGLTLDTSKLEHFTEWMRTMWNDQ